jgi:hypothetical protein
VAETLLTDRRAALFVIKLLTDRPDYRSKNWLMMAAIAAGEYKHAMQVFGDRSLALHSEEIAHAFNFACAEWGLTGKPPEDIFAHVAKLGDEESLATGKVARADVRERPDVNFLQCMAMTYSVLGEHSKAIRSLAMARRTILLMPPMPLFSCWRYLTVNRHGMTMDLEEMRAKMKDRSRLVPKFLQPPARRLVM